MATLIHDDIIYEAQIRRGEIKFLLKFGNEEQDIKIIFELIDKINMFEKSLLYS